MAVYNSEAEAVVIIIIQPYQEKSSFYALGLDMAIALDIPMAMAMAKPASLL